MTVTPASLPPTVAVPTLRTAAHSSRLTRASQLGALKPRFSPFSLSQPHAHSHSHRQIARLAWLLGCWVVLLALCSSTVVPTASALRCIPSCEPGPLVQPTHHLCAMRTSWLLGTLECQHTQDCLAGILTLSWGPVATFARHDPIWSPSNSSRPTFVASASSTPSPASWAQGSSLRLVAGEGQPVPGSCTLRPQDSRICNLSCVSSSLLASQPWKIMLLLSPTPRQDTTRHGATLRGTT